MAVGIRLSMLWGGSVGIVELAAVVLAFVEGTVGNYHLVV